MPIRPIDTVAALKPWLPSDYSATGWTDALLQQALDDGHDPRLIAAEVWEDFALTLSADVTAAESAVKSWTNLDVSVEYAESHSPRDVALRQARFHRSRAKVRAVRLAAPTREGEAPDLGGE